MSTTVPPAQTCPLIPDSWQKSYAQFHVSSFNSVFWVSIALNKVNSRVYIFNAEENLTEKIDSVIKCGVQYILLRYLQSQPQPDFYKFSKSMRVFEWDLKILFSSPGHCQVCLLFWVLRIPTQFSPQTLVSTTKLPTLGWLVPLASVLSILHSLTSEAGLRPLHSSASFSSQPGLNLSFSNCSGLFITFPSATSMFWLFHYSLSLFLYINFKYSHLLIVLCKPTWHANTYLF